MNNNYLTAAQHYRYSHRDKLCATLVSMYGYVTVSCIIYLTSSSSS